MDYQTLTETIAVNVSEQQAAALRGLAAARGVPMSTILRDMIADETGIEAMPLVEQRKLVVLNRLHDSPGGLDSNQISELTQLSPQATQRLLKKLREEQMVQVVGLRGRTYVYDISERANGTIFL